MKPPRIVFTCQDCAAQSPKMTAPGTLMMAKMFVPETGLPETMGTVKLDVERTDVNVIDAGGRGTGEGLHLALNVGAMLISFLSLVALLNAMLGLAGLSLQQILGWAFSPVAWAMGVPWSDAATIGNLLGTRMVLNEFVAYSQLGPLKASLDPNSFTIATFALCGFANFSSIGHPDRRHRGARAEPPPRPGAPGPARNAGGHAGQLHDGDHRGIPAMSDEYTRVQTAAAFVRARITAKWIGSFMLFLLATIVEGIARINGKVE